MYALIFCNTASTIMLLQPIMSIPDPLNQVDSNRTIHPGSSTAEQSTHSNSGADLWSSLRALRASPSS